ncbi:MAG: 23S rRNA (adenine(2503)-C(2))-methyltransferase RlmN [Clostridia bacterium]|nr:23S rRNA (adenine(2503)-C(2))-methyltransferase RlmN [Clostridia bacterium]MBR6005837.1 23S rRNA (adenine(2503)-C(2))-methyltransferase RlmN [Clostridia bacterium]
MNDIRSMSPAELEAALKDMSQPAYRAKQVFSWLHKQKVSSFDEMTNIPVKLRNELASSFPFYGCVIRNKQVSKLDSTVKYLFELHDGELIESVVMKYKYGYTVCVSTQAGCKMKCAFCASALGGFHRNLSAGEILGEIYAAENDLGITVSHIVLMGMGEPLDNYDNVLRFLRLVTDENGHNISMRNISLSTCGIVPKIYDLLNECLQLTLSVSLHAPFDELRSRIMPVNRKYGIDELLKACREYAETTSRRISFEYAMLGGVNDSDECARALAKKLKGMLCHVNLIPVNEVKESPFHPCSPEQLKRFSDILEKNGITVTVRRKLGSDIDASCGQLRLKHTEGNSV